MWGYDQLSPNLIHALIATEDERFAEHSGIDARALSRFGETGGDDAEECRWG